MVIAEIINKIRTLRQAEEDEVLTDDQTRDKYLRSLRRERRTQLEEVEKERLKKQIKAFQKARDRKYLWGVKETIQKKVKMIQAKKQVNILRNGHAMLKKAKAKKIKTGFLNKSNL